MTRPIITMIAAIGRNNELGRNGKLIWEFQDDMAYFIENTKGRVIIMGRKTFVDCIGHPLAGRINVVITSNKDADGVKDGVYYVPNMQQAIEVAKSICTIHSISEIIIIGGETTYRRGMRYADGLYITHIDAVCPDADSYFPPIDPVVWRPMWNNPTVDKETGIPFTITGYSLIV